MLPRRNSIVVIALSAALNLAYSRADGEMSVAITRPEKRLAWRAWMPHPVPRSSAIVDVRPSCSPASVRDAPPTPRTWSSGRALFRSRKRERDVGDCRRQTEHEESREHRRRVKLDQQIEGTHRRDPMRAGQRGRRLGAEQLADALDGEAGQGQIGAEALDELWPCVQLRSGIHCAIQS